MTQRDKFERYAETQGWDTQRASPENNRYFHERVELLWQGWQGCLASDGRRSVEDLEDAIAVLNESSPMTAIQDIFHWMLGRPDEYYDIVLANHHSFGKA